jgi:hypothetical protein
MASLSVLTSGELNAIERACQHLVDVYDQHAAISRALYVEVSTAIADIHVIQEDRAEKERRHRIALAAQQDAVLPS